MADKVEAPASDRWQHWHDEIELAAKQKGFKSWQTEAKRIIKRYRDDRGDLDAVGDGMSGVTGGSRFNILWSNVQTLLPALFAKQPKPVVERRYLDRDDVGRTASVILERALLYELDSGSYQTSLRKAVLDRLLPGRGVIWVRYEPKFTSMAPQASGGDEELDEPGENNPAQEQVASESTPVDYVDWQDFTTSPARTWEEVWWIDRLVYMSREQLRGRFKGKTKGGELIADVIPLDWSPNKDLKSQPGVSPDTGKNEGEKRAKIHETWDINTRKVTWWAASWHDDVLDEQDDPLQLEGFWPTPKPLYATVTNNSLIPVPDYHEYEDQASELDDLTNRIMWLTQSIKIAGVYDASVEELKRIFLEGKENELVGIDNMAEFVAKAGPNGMGAIWLAPIEKQVAALKELYIAREQVKQSLYEITGISDIVRGSAAAGGAKTATEQRIKGQFASMRLNDMQAEVARFARDTLRIMGEIIAEHFDPMTLRLISGYDQYAKEQWPDPVPQQAPQMGHNGGPPMASPGAPPQPGMPPQGAQPPMPPQMAPMPMGVPQQSKADEMFAAAIALLKNDKLRGFRIDIETDSLIEADQQEMQASRTALLQAISQFLPEAIQAGAQVPELKPLMARLLMFFLRGFKASRDIESAFEQFIDDVTKDAALPKPPPPPTPEMIAAQAEMAKQKSEDMRAQQDAQIKAAELQQQGQLEQAKLQQEGQIKMAEMQQEAQLEAAKLAQERELEILRIQAETDRHAQQLAHDREKHADEMTMRAHEAQQTSADGEAEREFKRDEKQIPPRAEFTKLVDNHKTGIDEIKTGIEKVGTRVDGLDKKIDAVAEDAAAPIEIMRGPDGRATGIKRGKRTMTIKRGANGRAEAVQ